MKKDKVFLTALFFILAANRLWAQYGIPSQPYLVAAQLDLAVDAQADVWLNGIHIAHCPHTPLGTGYKTVIARPDSLCYFKKTNLLAIRVEAAKGSGGDPFIGVAYAFRFRLSDGTYRVVSSSATEDHRCFYLSSWERDEPDGWREMGFDDTRWAAAQNAGDMIPNTASLSGGDFGGVANFLSATSAGYTVQRRGEKQLFRRPFNLDISVNPRCLPRSSAAPPSRPWSSSISSHPALSITPEVLPTRKEPLASSPQWVPSPRRIVLPAPPVWPTLTPTPPVYWPPVLPPAQPTPTRVWVAPLPTVLPARPIYTPTMVVQNDGAIAFGVSNANILVMFGDGPGWYQVEAVDKSFTHLKTLLNQRIMTESEMWLSWDGKDDEGNDVPPGRYYILCSKEGTILQKIILRRVPQ